MKILVDTEEMRSNVPHFLSEFGVVVEVARIPVGDYVMPDGALVERKAVSDLHGCLANGRLWSQVAALRCSRVRTYLLVEGQAIDQGFISSHGVRGALFQVADNGISVIRSDGARDSAVWLSVLALRSLRRDSRDVTQRRGRRRSVVSPSGLLATVPGVSPACAVRLMRRFGSVAAIAVATEADLLEVKGIGAVRAATLRALLANNSSK